MSELLAIIKERASQHPIIVTLSTIAAISLAAYLTRKKQIKRITILDTIGNTPLIYLPKLSKAANCHIYVKILQ
jgi:hypothetical protein